MPQIGIVIPARNSSETLRETIISIVGQSFPDWEAVIVDDRSTDNTADLAREWVANDSRIRLVGGQGRGVANARNGGAAMTSAPWLLFLDSDDLIDPMHLSTMLAAITSTKPDVVVSSGARLAPDGRLGPKETPPRANLFSYFGLYNSFRTHACILRRDVFYEFNGFDDSLATCEDWDLWQRLARAGKSFTFVDDCLAVYRMRPNSISRDPRIVFQTARTVIERGHGRDARVRDPLPEYVMGLPKTSRVNAVIGLATWCAGTVIGRGQSAAAFLESAKLPKGENIQADHIVSMLLGGIQHGACALPEDWPALWPAMQSPIQSTLNTIEKLGSTTSRAGQYRLELARKIEEMWGGPTPSKSTLSDLDDKRHYFKERQESKDSRTTEDLTARKAPIQSADVFVSKIDAPDVSSVVVIGAHPDDELIGAGGHLARWPALNIVHVTNGAPSDKRYALEAGFPNPASYAVARKQEAANAVAIIGLSADRIVSLEFDDQSTSFHLAELSRRIYKLLLKLRPDVVVTHAYEGGHPDHDATCFGVHAACRLLLRTENLSPAIVEMSSYFGHDGIRCTSSFLTSLPKRITISLDEESKTLKRRMFDCHASQKKTLDLFPIESESFRPAPDYDFLSPPHSGKLFYEFHNLGLKGSHWRELAARALHDLEIQ